MFLNQLTLLLLLPVALVLSKNEDIGITVNIVEVTETTEKELIETSYASCSKYFDKYCAVKNSAKTPYCTYQKYEFDDKYEELKMSPEILKHCTTCGIQKFYENNGTMTKIYGGRESLPHSWPWMASLHKSITKRRRIHGVLQNETTSEIICAASLISEKHAITATRCLLDSDTKFKVQPDRWYLVKNTLNIDIFLRFGDHLSRDCKYEPQQDVPIRSFAIFNTKADGFERDLAILEIEGPLDFNSVIQPVCLPPPNLKLEEKTKCVVVGWGLVNRIPPVPATSLQEAETRILSPGLCALFDRKFKMDMHVCVYDPEKGVLNGDSGGGLYCKIHPNDEQWYLYGVASFSWMSNGVSGFSRVPFYVDWIHKMIV